MGFSSRETNGVRWSVQETILRQPHRRVTVNEDGHIGGRRRSQAFRFLGRVSHDRREPATDPEKALGNGRNHAKHQ